VNSSRQFRAEARSSGIRLAIQRRAISYSGDPLANRAAFVLLASLASTESGLPAPMGLRGGPINPGQGEVIKIRIRPRNESLKLPCRSYFHDRCPRCNLP
jgi:hypothetical protein